MITFISDGFEAIKIGFNYRFYRIAKLSFRVPLAYKKHGLNYNNNAIEKHDEDFKQRSKVMRGFKSKSSGSDFTEMRRIVYNFVRTHLGLGKTPADEAELKIPPESVTDLRNTIYRIGSNIYVLIINTNQLSSNIS